MQSEVGARGNRLLMAFPPEIATSLSAKLESVTLRRRTVLLESGAVASHVYFPDSCLISLVKTMSDGRTAEVAVIGPEGLVGVLTLMGMNPSAFEAIVQVDGTARRMAVAALRTEMERSTALRDLITRYMNYRITQLAQTAACNRLHTLRQRCCRWLLTAQDCVGETTFTLTHEFLAMMMGVNRPRLSVTLGRLQAQGMIEYRYTTVRIIDRQALAEGSCECYATLRRECELVYGC